MNIGVIRVENKGIDHETCSEQTIVLPPGSKPHREVSVRHHFGMVLFPAISNSRFRDNIDNREPISVSLPEL